MMRKVLMVTDSSATVPADLAEELGTQVVPIILKRRGVTLKGQRLATRRRQLAPGDGPTEDGDSLLRGDGYPSGM